MPRTMSRSVAIGLLVVGSLVMALPLAYILFGSFSTARSFSANPILPAPEAGLNNYAELFEAGGQIPLWVANTLFRFSWYLVLGAVVAVALGYVFARLHFKGRDAMFAYILASLMVPTIVFIIPNFIIYARFPLAGGNDLFGQGGTGFLNQWPSLLIGGIIHAQWVFFMRQTILSIPRDIDDAARIDGANTRQILRYVIVPLLKPAFVAMVILRFIEFWNDFQWPYIAVGANRDVWQISQGMQALISYFIAHSGGIPVPEGVIFAAAIISTIPTVGVYLLFQRYFVEGVQGFGLK